MSIKVWKKEIFQKNEKISLPLKKEYKEVGIEAGEGYSEDQRME